MCVFVFNYIHTALIHWFIPQMLTTAWSRNSIQVSHLGGEDPTTWAITCCLPGYTLIGSWDCTSVEGERLKRCLITNANTSIEHVICSTVYHPVGFYVSINLLSVLQWTPKNMAWKYLNHSTLNYFHLNSWHKCTSRNVDCT